MQGICGADCGQCGFGKAGGCKGCAASDGCPLGQPCFIARYIRTGGRAAYDAFVAGLLEEINALGIPGMPPVTELFPLNGSFVNLAYPVGGKAVQLLDDREVYLGAQVESAFNDGTVCRCFGVVANTEFLLVGEYGPNGTAPELILYKKR